MRRMLPCFLVLSTLRAGSGQELEGRVKLHKLPNGMEFLLLERHVSPTISFHMRFKAGSVDESYGTGGTAHLLEHMLFKGTTTLGTKDWSAESKVLAKIAGVGRKLDALRLQPDAAPGAVHELEEELERLQKEAAPYVVKDEIDSIYSMAGGVGFNASTNADLTTYMVDLPQNRFALWARIEADRMLHPVLREYYSERSVIMEERRMRTDANPSGKLFELFGAAAYLAHNYGNPVIGWPSEIPLLALDRTEDFRRVHYAPNNTVTAIVGDFETGAILPILESYFGRIPAQELPRPASVREPPQAGERRIEARMDANPMVYIGYHKPTLPSREDYVFDVISALLAEGRSSRLHTRLVKKDRIAAMVNAFNGYPGARHDNLFTLIAVPLAPHTTREIEDTIEEELDRLKTGDVAEGELAKIVNNLEADFIRGLDSNSGLAQNLSYFQAVAGDWRYLTNHVDVIRTVRKDEIRDAAKRFLTRENRTVATLVQQAKPAAGPGSSADESGEEGAR